MTDLCWNSDCVYKVINIDADFVPDAVFWAIDHDAPLTLKNSEGEVRSEVTTDNLVSSFLDPSRNHYQLAVLGATGTGKSHLIHRMRQKIQNYAEYEILAVRRLETNLHAIIKKMIGQLPVDQQERYRTELDNAGPNLSTPDLQKNTLLDCLAQAIEEDVQRSDSGIDPELEGALLTSLPDMFRDPYLRHEKFLRPGEIVPELVDRLFSTKEGKRLEERILFDRSNLPLEGILQFNCSVQARNAIHIFLYDSDRIVPSTLSVINRCLDRAISKALNFSGNQLNELMGEMRAYLKSQGKELVIMFEEFARLQGYDSAMLEALLVQGDEKHCNIRWAVACTTGLFHKFPDTVRSRMDSVIDMDYQSKMNSVNDFAGRYLNAVRIGSEALEKEFTRSSNSKVPNACETCPKQNDCKDAFGETSDGYSLYPFTENVLKTMTTAVNPEFKTKFNPRKFQKHILRKVLIDEAVALKSDNFPTVSLVADLDLPPLSPVNQELLRSEAGNRFDRYRVLFQLWSEGRLENPPDGIMRAFGLEPLKRLKPPGQTKPPSHPNPPEPIQLQGPDPASVKLAEWAEGKSLDQTLAQRIRQALFPLIDRAIDWDAIGLLPNEFSAPTGSKPFRNSSISFVRQTTTGGAIPTVRFELPFQKTSAGFNQAVIAFEALLSSEKSNTLSEGKLFHLGALFELVEACADDVVRQLHTLRRVSKKWDPISATVELLLVGSAIGGVLSTTQAQSDQGLIETLFKEMPPECPLTTRELQKLYDILRSNRANLQKLLRTHISASKGGHAGRFINPVIPLTTARLFRRRNWHLKHHPDVLSDPYKLVGDLYEKVQEKIHQTLLEEQAQRSSWVCEVEAKLGLSVDKQEVLYAVDQTLDAAAKGGLRGNRESLKAARNNFASVQFVAAVEAAQRIRGASTPESVLPSYARAQRTAVKATEELIYQWIKFLDSTEAEVQDQRGDDASTQLKQEAQRLNDSLSALIGELSNLKSKGTHHEPL